VSEQPENPVQPGDESVGDVPAAPSPETPTVVDSIPAPAPAWTPPEPPPESARATAGAIVAERPEIAVGGAFAGGLVLALILKRLAR